MRIEEAFESDLMILALQFIVSMFCFIIAHVSGLDEARSLGELKPHMHGLIENLRCHTAIHLLDRMIIHDCLLTLLVTA